MNSFDKKVLDRLSETIPLDNWENVRDTIRRAVALARKEILKEIELIAGNLYMYDLFEYTDKSRDWGNGYGQAIKDFEKCLHSFLQEEKQGGEK